MYCFMKKRRIKIQSLSIIGAMLLFSANIIYDFYKEHSRKREIKSAIENEIKINMISFSAIEEHIESVTINKKSLANFKVNSIIIDSYDSLSDDIFKASIQNIDILKKNESEAIIIMYSAQKRFQKDAKKAKYLYEVEKEDISNYNKLLISSYNMYIKVSNDALEEIRD